MLALPAVVPRGWLVPESGLVWDNDLCVIAHWNLVGDSYLITPFPPEKQAARESLRSTDALQTLSTAAQV